MIKYDDWFYIQKRAKKEWKHKRPAVKLFSNCIDLDDEFDYVMPYERRNFVVPEYTDEERRFTEKELTNTQKNLYYVLKAATLNGMVGILTSRQQLMEASHFAAQYAYHAALNRLEDLELITIKHIKAPALDRSAPRTVIFINCYARDVDPELIKRYPQHWFLKGEE